MATIDGSIQLVKVVTDAELRQNGGSFVVAGRMAQPIQGFDTLTKRAGGGNAIPVYVVSDAQIADGTFRLKGGSASPMADIDVVGANVKTIQGAAIPVYVASGTLAGAGGAGVPYYQRVLDTQSANLIAYWRLNETSGTVADNAEGTAARDGAYTGVTLGQPGIGDGGTAPLFDGVNDFCNIWTTSLSSAFNGAEGTLMIWGKVSAASVWTDGNFRFLASLRVNASNAISVLKNNTNMLRWQYTAAGTAKSVELAVTPTGFFQAVITWSAANDNDQVIAYYNGAQTGATQTGLGTWAGFLGSTLTNVGCLDSGSASNPWSGLLAHVALWTTPLSAAEIAALA